MEFLRPARQSAKLSGMRRPFQFSLKAIFALTFLVAVGCALYLAFLKLTYTIRLVVALIACFLLPHVMGWLSAVISTYSGVRKHIKEARAQGKELTPSELQELYERISWSVIATTPFIGHKRLPKQKQAESGE